MLKRTVIWRYIWAFVLATVPLSAGAADLEDDLSACASIKRDRARLACFDEIAAKIAPPPAEPAAAPEPPPATQGTIESPPDSAEPAPAPPPVQSQRGTKPETAPVVESAVRGNEEDLFGFESQVQTTTPDEIRTRYMGEFTGWSGRTLFRLENGQVWKQIDNSKLVWKASSPVVTIRKGAFGSFRLGIEGVNKTVKVKRVK